MTTIDDVAVFLANALNESPESSPVPLMGPVDDWKDEDEELLGATITSSLYQTLQALRPYLEEALHTKNFQKVSCVSFLLAAMMIYSLLLGEKTQATHFALLLRCDLERTEGRLHVLIAGGDEAGNEDECRLGRGEILSEREIMGGDVAVDMVFTSLRSALRKHRASPTQSVTPYIVDQIKMLFPLRDGSFRCRRLARDLVLAISGDIALVREERKLVMGV